MKKAVLIIILASISSISFSQGVSFSYLIPTNGYFAAPISPFSLRGISMGGDVIAFETGASLYNIPGLPMTGLPFKSEDPLTGPQFAVLIPGQLTFSVGVGSGVFKLLAGGFGIYHFFPKINYGNFDKAIRKYEGWDVANAELDLKNKPGGGWIAGFEVIVPYNRSVSISFGVQYLSGSSATALSGFYLGGVNGGNIITKNVNFPNAKTSLQGIEISLGASF